jgi:hypothetical protein
VVALIQVAASVAMMLAVPATVRSQVSSTQRAVDVLVIDSVSPPTNT